MEHIFNGDCLSILDKIEPNSVDLVYIDPPFFTQSIHQLATKDGKRSFSFSDVWGDDVEYANFIFSRISKVREKLRNTGSIFFHCDRSASHIIRLLLDSVFGQENFQSEIIWSFKRWSNAKKGLLNSHQTIYFYSKTSDFKFNHIYGEYSESTNIDQIMQRRTRDNRNKSVYDIDKNGSVVFDSTKKGVPLSDVWEIPFLNPKAKERVGYPTQKPVILLERIISLVTAEGDMVLDPFCGSGTTLVAAKNMNRRFVGIDISQNAIELTKERIKDLTITRSLLMKKGRKSYEQYNKDALTYLHGFDFIPIQRNKGIDCLLKESVCGLPVFVRIQRPNETREETFNALKKATVKKGKCIKIIIATKNDEYINKKSKEENIFVINSTSLNIGMLLSEIDINIRT